jgi:hypothetical protein
MKKTTTPILTALAAVALSALSAGAINLSGGTISLVSGETIYVNNASDTMGSGFLSAAGNLTIAGPGAWSLSGGGPLNITAGILTASNTSGGGFCDLGNTANSADSQFINNRWNR